MILKRLELKNFRNYEQADINFDKGTILIIGDNGQGKTNLLESIYYISSGRSHRGSSTKEVIKAEKDFALLRAYTLSKTKETLIEIELRRDDTYKIRINKGYRRKKADFINILPVVIFSPDDLNLVKGSPSFRRAYLDGILDRTVKGFTELRIKYHKTLMQRNSLIKSMRQAQDPLNPTLLAWNEKLIGYGTAIMEHRNNLVNAIKDEFSLQMEYFFGGKAQMGYVASWQRNRTEEGLEDIRVHYENNMESCLKKDLSLATTTIGPHRDDISLALEGKYLRSFGSQGQQRLAALCLRLGELLYIFKKLGEPPILLLDDVLSELDVTRKQLLIKKLEDRFQTFITATNVDYLKGVKINVTGKYEVDQGTAKRLGLR